MKQNIFIALALLVALAALGVNILKKAPVGSLFVEENAYSADVTYSTNALNTGAELVLARATSSRTYAKICHSPVNTSVSLIFLFKQAGSSGVAINSGTAIYASSSSNGANCMKLDALDPYLGAIFAISTASNTLIIESVQE